jgi:iron transport multicopper oxidase
MARSEYSDADKSSFLTTDIIQSPALSRWRRSFHTGILLVVVLVLALALGLGLGLGLKHGKHDQSSPNSANGVTVVPRSQLVDPAQFVLSPSFNVNATPQSREFNWTVSQINSDPAGTSKNMLVVNGISPGPTIEVNIGDRQDLLLSRLILR